MRKLKLELDALLVEAFEIGSGEGSGTIMGHASAANEDTCTHNFQTGPAHNCPNTDVGCDTTIQGCSERVVC